MPADASGRFHKGMEKLCSVCGQSFRPAFVYQVAVTGDGQRGYYCSLDCRKGGLGDEAFRAQRARRAPSSGNSE